MTSIVNILITLTNHRRGISKIIASCGFLDDSSSPSIEKEIEVLKGHERRKCFWPWDELEIEYFENL